MMLEEMIDRSELSEELKSFIVDNLEACQKFVRGYVQSLGFTSMSHDDTSDTLFEGSGNFNENWDVWEEIFSVISDTDVHSILEDCIAFMQEAFSLIPQDRMEEAGTDFNFTRNGHGAGFWDGDWEHGDKLTKMSKIYGSQYLVGTKDREGNITVVDLFS